MRSDTDFQRHPWRRFAPACPLGHSGAKGAVAVSLIIEILSPLPSDPLHHMLYSRRLRGSRHRAVAPISNAQTRSILETLSSSESDLTSWVEPQVGGHIAQIGSFVRYGVFSLPTPPIWIAQRGPIRSTHLF
jgi:hypothetical protein